ncbi:glycosyltransferase family 2 protein [Limosilactobacillus portuensis]
MLISVVTTVYNNSEGLLQLFDKLVTQEEHNFEWIIIDDGSNFEQRKIMTKIRTNNIPFKIMLYHQANQGKHIALNYAFSKAKGDVTIIVDSDDKPLSTMISIINKYWTAKRMTDERLGIITFERGITFREPLRSLPKGENRDNYIDFRYKNSLYGDYAETFKTSILKKYSFPNFYGEKFLNEGYILNKLGEKYDSLFIDRIIYLSSYRNEGLTKNIRKIEWNNPVGTFEVCKMGLDNINISKKQMLKNIIKYYLFGIKNKISLRRLLNNIPNKIASIICIPIAVFLYFVFSIQYN